MRRLCWLLVFFPLWWMSPVWAQTAIGYESTLGAQGVTPVSPTTPLPVNVAASSPAADITSTGNITSTQSVVIAINGQSSIGIQVAGTFTGTLVFEGTVDNTNWIPTTAVSLENGIIWSSITSTDVFQANPGGLIGFRVRGNTIATGTAVITLRASVGISTVMADNPFPVTGWPGMTALAVSAATPNTASVTNPASTLTLPSTTTAYTAGNLICTSATVGTCNTALASQTLTIGNTAGAVSIQRMRLTTNDATSTAWGAQTIQIDLWSAAPTFATTGDRGSFTADFLTGSAGHLGAFTCVMSAELADGAYSECYPNVGNAALIRLASGTSIFWTAQAVTGSGVTGASKVFTLTAELQN